MNLCLPYFGAKGVGAYGDGAPSVGAPGVGALDAGAYIVGAHNFGAHGKTLNFIQSSEHSDYNLNKMNLLDLTTCCKPGHRSIIYMTSYRHDRSTVFTIKT